MSSKPVPSTLADPLAAVEASSRGAGGTDRVGLAIASALARRAATQDGEARQLLARRVEQRLADIAAKKAAAELPLPRSGDRPDALAALSELVDRLGRSTVTPAQQVVRPSPAARRASTPMSAPPPLRALVEFKGTWSRLRVEHRLREALAQVPPSAGPLNTSHLVNRTLQALHALSPQYLEAFMTHVETLLWLEQASGGGDLATRNAPAGAGKPKSVARAARKG